MSVYYKFKNNLDHDIVPLFDGLSFISVADLRKSIKKKIGKSSDFHLKITNAQTKEGDITDCFNNFSVITKFCLVIP